MERKPKKRSRYNADRLLYEAFYVALRNSMIVSILPIGLFLFLCAIEDYDMNRGFMAGVLSVIQVVFIISFFINFFYYVFFIRLRKIYSYVLVLAISCGLTFAIFFSDYRDILGNPHQALIVSVWFVLLGVIIIVNRTGDWPGDKETKYEKDTWLYRHALAANPQDDEEDTEDPEDRYNHKYVDTDIYASDPYADEEDADDKPRHS
ncbi:MAG: hypothetical protein JWM96_93 [Alphaproteobacteria bacterium]|nr:hypothetical protein [Alphaproteobacteria bacterium]